MKRIIIISLLLAVAGIASAAGIGTWKAYMAYSDVTQVEKAGNTIYVLASNSLYSYNTDDHSIQTFDKANALTDCDISHIAWCPSASRLLIVYSNGNMDIMDKSANVVNLPEYYNYSTSNDKTINDVYISGTSAYLSTGFGVVKVNMKEAQIDNTYTLGFSVSYTYISGNNIYAASSAQRATYTASLTDNLLNPASWQRSGSYTAKTDETDPELLDLVNTLSPGGPKTNYMGFLRMHNDKLYTVNGTTSSSVPANLQVLAGNEWTIYDTDIEDKLTHRLYNFFSCDVDPGDENHVYAGGQTGVYEFQDGKFVKEYNCDNSPLQIAYTVINSSSSQASKRNYVIVTDVKFDNNRNLWLTNSIAYSQSLFELKYGEQQLTSHHKQELMIDDAAVMESMKGMFFDSQGLMWFVNDYFRVPAVVCYNKDNDAIKLYDTFVNQDGTTLNVDAVHCIAEDKDNNIWIGTISGPVYLPRNVINSGDETFTQVKVPRNDGTNYADYLLSGVNVVSMAVDGANRKWFGTENNGVYLISADNLTQLEHFTAENSSLLSNYVKSIAINGKTGEVFFGTERGLCSYQSDATDANEDMNKDNVYAYPNPVSPDYTGLITIVGLSYNADVKIATANGIVVAEGKSNGGTFTWNGLDKKGHRVASGVYMVETAKSDGSKGTVCKIAIIK